MSHYQISPVGHIHTPFPEKFGIPRQPGLIPSAQGTISLEGEFNTMDALREIEGFSHLWILFLFHQNLQTGWKPTVRPPRLGGNQKVGVFASRSSFRPNGIGQSVVKLEATRWEDNKAQLLVSAVDMMDGSPIIDIKPYVPYSDIVSSATSGFLPTREIPNLDVVIPTNVQDCISRLETAERPRFQQLINEVLAQDPRPAYHAEKASTREYGIRLYDQNIRFSVDANTITVIEVEMFKSDS